MSGASHRSGMRCWTLSSTPGRYVDTFTNWWGLFWRLRCVEAKPTDRRLLTSVRANPFAALLKRCSPAKATASTSCESGLPGEVGEHLPNLFPYYSPPIFGRRTANPLHRNGIFSYLGPNRCGHSADTVRRLGNPRFCVFTNLRTQNGVWPQMPQIVRTVCPQKIPFLQGVRGI